jgi:hypothetical protein
MRATSIVPAPCNVASAMAPSPLRTLQRRGWPLLAVLWLGLVGYGLHARFLYETTAGEMGRSPPTFPAASRIQHREGRATLLMFVHAECPCTRASLYELRALLAADTATSAVVVVAPGSGQRWEDSPAGALAQKIPGLVRFDDLDQREATRFGADTSGHVVFYDAQGQLRFSGGITASRGHVGANVGSNALRGHLAQANEAQAAHAVYGCPLREDIDAGATQ